MAETTLRIGLIADTHEADEPVRLADELAALECDLYVHLGDVGGSREITAAVRQFKQYPESAADLPSDRDRVYQANLDRGMPALRAYLDAVLARTPAARQARLAETRGNYDAIVRRLAGLPNAVCLSGNTDRLLMACNAQLQAPFALTGLPFVTWPTWREVAGCLIIFWPSLGRDQVAAPELGQLVEELLRVAAGYRTVSVLAHEQLFKGPAPETFRRNALARGYRPLTVPNYEPNLSWAHLTRLLRGLPADTRIYYVHGHVHDGNEVLGAGAPYLRALPGGGLSYRIPGHGKSAGRRVPSYSVPIDHLAVLTVAPDDAKFEAWRPTRAGASAPDPGSAISAGKSPSWSPAPE